MSCNFPTRQCSRFLLLVQNRICLRDRSDKYCLRGFSGHSHLRGISAQTVHCTRERICRSWNRIDDSFLGYGVLYQTGWSGKFRQVMRRLVDRLPCFGRLALGRCGSCCHHTPSAWHGRKVERRSPIPMPRRWSEVLSHNTFRPICTYVEYVSTWRKSQRWDKTVAFDDISNVARFCIISAQ